MQTRTLSKEETEELYRLRVPTTDQLALFAARSGYDVEIDIKGRVLLADNIAVQWDPLNRLDQNHKLLGAVIAIGDCKLFYDDGVDEYFFYKYLPGTETAPPIAHRANLNEAVLEAAMELWFPLRNK